MKLRCLLSKNLVQTVQQHGTFGSLIRRRGMGSHGIVRKLLQPNFWVSEEPHTMQRGIAGFRKSGLKDGSCMIQRLKRSALLTWIARRLTSVASTNGPRRLLIGRWCPILACSTNRPVALSCSRLSPCSCMISEPVCHACRRCVLPTSCS